MSQGNMSRRLSGASGIGRYAQVHTITLLLEDTLSPNFQSLLHFVVSLETTTNLFRCLSWSCFYELSLRFAHKLRCTYADKCMSENQQRGMCNCHVSLLTFLSGAAADGMRGKREKKKSLTRQTQSTVVCVHRSDSWECVSGQGGRKGVSVCCCRKKEKAASIKGGVEKAGACVLKATAAVKAAFVCVCVTVRVTRVPMQVTCPLSRWRVFFWHLRLYQQTIHVV